MSDEAVLIAATISAILSLFFTVLTIKTRR